MPLIIVPWWKAMLYRTRTIKFFRRLNIMRRLRSLRFQLKAKLQLRRAAREAKARTRPKPTTSVPFVREKRDEASSSMSATHEERLPLVDSRSVVMTPSCVSLPAPAASLASSRSPHPMALTPASTITSLLDTDPAILRPFKAPTRTRTTPSGQQQQQQPRDQQRTQQRQTWQEQQTKTWQQPSWQQSHQHHNQQQQQYQQQQQQQQQHHHQQQQQHQHQHQPQYHHQHQQQHQQQPYQPQLPPHSQQPYHPQQQHDPQSWQRSQPHPPWHEHHASCDGLLQSDVDCKECSGSTTAITDSASDGGRCDVDVSVLQLQLHSERQKLARLRVPEYHLSTRPPPPSAEATDWALLRLVAAKRKKMRQQLRELDGDDGTDEDTTPKADSSGPRAIPHPLSPTPSNPPGAMPTYPSLQPSSLPLPNGPPTPPPATDSASIQRLLNKTIDSFDRAHLDPCQPTHSLTQKLQAFSRAQQARASERDKSDMGGKLSGPLYGLSTGLSGGMSDMTRSPIMAVHSTALSGHSGLLSGTVSGPLSGRVSGGGESGQASRAQERTGLSGVLSGGTELRTVLSGGLSRTASTSVGETGPRSVDSGPLDSLTRSHDRLSTGRSSAPSTGSSHAHLVADFPKGVELVEDMETACTALRNMARGGSSIDTMSDTATLQSASSTCLDAWKVQVDRMLTSRLPASSVPCCAASALLSDLDSASKAVARLHSMRAQHAQLSHMLKRGEELRRSVQSMDIVAAEVERLEGLNRKLAAQVSRLPAAQREYEELSARAAHLSELEAELPGLRSKAETVELLRGETYRSAESAARGATGAGVRVPGSGESGGASGPVVRALMDRVGELEARNQALEQENRGLRERNQDSASYSSAKSAAQFSASSVSLERTPGTHADFFLSRTPSSLSPHASGVLPSPRTVSVTSTRHLLYPTELRPLTLPLGSAALIT